MIVIVTSGYALLLATASGRFRSPQRAVGRASAPQRRKATRSAAATGGGTEKIGEIPPHEPVE